MITYCIETLYHFTCSRCKQGWSVGDFNKKKEHVFTCPHCGLVDRLKEDQRRERCKPKNTAL